MGNGFNLGVFSCLYRVIIWVSEVLKGTVTSWLQPEQKSTSESRVLHVYVL